MTHLAPLSTPMVQVTLFDHRRLLLDRITSGRDIFENLRLH